MLISRKRLVLGQTFVLRTDRNMPLINKLRYKDFSFAHAQPLNSTAHAQISKSSQTSYFFKAISGKSMLSAIISQKIRKPDFRESYHPLRDTVGGVKRQTRAR